jgi:hypothetical protein
MLLQITSEREGAWKTTDHYMKNIASSDGDISLASRRYSRSRSGSEIDDPVGGTFVGPVFFLLLVSIGYFFFNMNLFGIVLMSLVFFSVFGL